MIIPLADNCDDYCDYCRSNQKCVEQVRMIIVMIFKIISTSWTGAHDKEEARLEVLPLRDSAGLLPTWNRIIMMDHYWLLWIIVDYIPFAIFIMMTSIVIIFCFRHQRILRSLLPIRFTEETDWNSSVDPTSTALLIIQIYWSKSKWLNPVLIQLLILLLIQKINSFSDSIFDPSSSVFGIILTLLMTMWKSY